MFCLNFCSIEMAVRNAGSQYNESIIDSYIVMGLERAKEMNNAKDTKKAYLRVYNTLLNTMCDTYISLKWREVCYNHLKKMMSLLSVIFSYKDFKKHKDELTLLAQYFCHQEDKHENINFCYSFETKNS